MRLFSLVSEIVPQKNGNFFQRFSKLYIFAKWWQIYNAFANKLALHSHFKLPSSSLICSRFCFYFHATQRHKKEMCRRLLSPYHSSSSSEDVGGLILGRATKQCWLKYFFNRFFLLEGGLITLCIFLFRGSWAFKWKGGGAVSLRVYLSLESYLMPRISSLSLAFVFAFISV